MAHEANPLVRTLARVMDQQSRLIRELTRDIKTIRSNVNIGGHSNNSKGRDAITFERFKKLGPPMFYETTDPLAPEEWLKHVDKIFVAMECNTYQRVVFASFILRGEADLWCDAKF